MEPRATLPLSAPAERIIADSRVPLAGAALAAVARATPIIALSDDHDLLRALTLAVREHAPLVTAPSVDRFVDQIASNGADLAMIDAATAPNPVAGFLNDLRRQFPDLQVVLVGAPHLQTELAPQIADGTIFRFAHRPASAQRLKLFLLTALRARASRDGARAPEASLPAIVVEPDGSRARASMGPRPPRLAAVRPHWVAPVLWGLTALGALAVGWYLSGHATTRHTLP